jgi:hypothetical protein
MLAQLRDWLLRLFRRSPVRPRPDKFVGGEDEAIMASLERSRQEKEGGTDKPESGDKRSEP